MSRYAIDWSELSLQVMLTFAHFLWQACVVGFVLLVVQHVGESLRDSQILRNRRANKKGASLGETDLRKANVRYTIACVAFFSLPICVAATFAWVHQARGPIVLEAIDSIESPSYQVATATEAIPVIVNDDAPVLSPPEMTMSADVTVSEPIAPVSIITSKPSPSERVQASAPYLLLTYSIGVAFMLARFSLSIIGSARLRRTIEPITDAKLLKTITEQCARLNLKRIPVVAICQRVSVPVVVGIVKPMILLPPTLLCGLDPNQLAAILNHELAHIRRYDLIVNLLQRVVEALLFFHPVTWWISRRVSIERENCCDDVAADCMGRLPYAGALLQMAELCVGNDRRRMASLASLSADGGSTSDFGYRVRRLIGNEETTRIGLTRRGFSIGLALVSLVAVSLVAWGQNQESEDERSEEGKMSKIFTPEPQWQTKLAADDAASEMSRISPIVVATGHVLSVSKDFDLRTGRQFDKPFPRLPRTSEFEVALNPMLRRTSSDRAFIVEAANRTPGNTWSGPSYDLRVLRATDGSQLGVTITLPGFFDGNSCDVDVENGGDFLLLGMGNEVHVYRTETGQIETTMPVKTKRIDAVAISPDREWLVVSDQNDLHFWRWREQAPVKTIHAGRKIDSLVFTPDGQYLAEGPGSGEDIQIRDMRTLEVFASLKDEVGSPLMVSSMDITPDGRYLVAHNEVSVDQTKLTIPHRIHVWDLQSRGKPVFQIATGEWVRKVAFSDDGRMIVGEFSGAAHGNLLAAWQLPNEVLERKANAPRDAIDRLGDGIQWSRSGDRDGLLSGARLILPDAGLKSGEPLVVEYRLANVSTETKTLTCYLNNGMQFTSLGHGNRISGFGFDRHREPVTLTIEPGEVFIDTEHLVSIDTTGLEPGNYQAALGSAFFYPDSVESNTTHEIPHRGSIPFTIVGESTVKTVELPKGDIHWGKPIAGLQLGARFTGDATQFVIGSTIEADLYVANVTDQPIECSVVLPHPIDGWLFNVEDSTGSTIMLERQAPKRIFRPQQYVHLRIAPGEIASLTGENVQASYSSDSTDDAFATTLPKAKFQVVGTKEDAEQDRTENIRGRLVSQGGAYSAIFDVTLLRPEIPALRLDLDSGNVRFTILGPNMTPVALQQSDSSNSQQQTAQVAEEPQWGEASDGLRCRIVPVSPTMDAEKVNLSVPQDRFQSPEEITFAVEIENVSDNPISIRDIRYGEGYAEETRAKTNANHFAPHLFEFTFTDLAGKAISRTQREFVLDSHALIVHGASITQIEPKQSIKCLLKPSMFQRSMKYRLAPGQYQVQVRYRGLNQATKDWIASKMQPKQPDNTWSHQVASNVAKFSITDNEFREPDLVWGPTIDGLQAALEIRVPRGSGIPTQAPGVPPTTTLTPILHVKNVSDKPVTFVSETGRQGDQLQIKTADGKDIEVKDAFYTGWPIDVRWTLQPGDVAELDVLTPSLNQNLTPGEYTAQYTIRFNSRQSKDEAGNQTFPAPGDYDSVIDTGWTPLFIRDPSQTIAETISRKTDAASSAEQQSQAADASERDILWGASVDGMRLGIRLSEFAKRKSPLRHGDHIKYEVWIKNETDEVVQIARDPRNLFSPKLMEDQSINVVGWSMFLSFGVPQEELIKAELNLAPGQASRRFVGQYHSASIRKPGSPRGRFGLEPLLIEPGKYPVYAQLGKLKSGIDEIEILPASRLQIRKANQVTDERREYVAQDPSEEIVTWQDRNGTKQEAAINWDGGVLVDEGDLAAVEVVAVDGQPDEYSIFLQLRPESAVWFARQTKSLAEMQEPNLLAVLLDGKPIIAPRLNSAISDGKIMISGRFTKADADSIASKLRSLKNANWITAPQVCVGKAYSDTAKAANWKWDEEQRVSLATPEIGEMLASRLPGANADFVVQFKLKLNDGAQCRLTVGDATFELSNSTEQTQLVIAGKEYAFKNDNQSLDWTMVSVKRLDNKLSVEVNGKPEISLGANAKAIEKISLQSTRGTIAVSNFVVTGDVQPSKVQVQGASNSTGLQGREDAAERTKVNLGQLRQKILGQWDVSPIAGNSGVVPNAESMTLKFSELDKYESYVHKQDYVEFASGSWKLAGDQISVKFKSVTMQPTDNAEIEAVFQVVAPEALVWNGIHFHKRTAATPIILAANHPLHAVAGELLSNLNSNSPNEAWRIVEISDKPPVKSPQILNSFDPSKAKGYRLLLTRDYRESANTMQQSAILPTEQKSRLRTEQMEIVLLTMQPTKAPAELKSRIEWLPSLSRWPTQDICLGDGVGYTWFVRAPLQDCHVMKDKLQLVGGDDMLVTLVQSLICTKNMPPRSDANTAASMLTTYGDRAVVAVEQAVLKKKPADEYWHLIGSLAEIRTDASTKLLIRLYQSEDTDLRRAAAYALAHKPFRREAAQVYLDLLKNRMSVEAASAACIELGLTEALPILEELFTNVNKPSSLRELDTVFAARRTLQGNPIPKTLIDASEIIYQSRASDPTDDGSVIGNAIKQLTESGDHEAVIMLALQMTNYVAKGSDDRIRALGTAILKSQKRAEAVLFLTRVLDSLQPREREQILKTINPLAPPATTSSLTPQPNPQQPNPYSTSSVAAKPVPTGPRKLAATIFGTTVYRDQLGSESAKAELSKLPQDQAAAKRLEIEGEALLSWITRRAIEDYVRREKIEITPEMSAQLIEVVNATELTPNPNSTMSEEQRRGGLQFMMRGSLMDWLVCKSLYERYGGRVGMGSLGLWIAVDGRNELIREYIKKGSIVINDAEVEKAFWKAANKPNFADAYPTGDNLKHLMSAPPFLREQKKKSASVE